MHPLYLVLENRTLEITVLYYYIIFIIYDLVDLLNNISLATIVAINHRLIFVQTFGSANYNYQPND